MNNTLLLSERMMPLAVQVGALHLGSRQNIVVRPSGPVWWVLSDQPKPRS